MMKHPALVRAASIAVTVLLAVSTGFFLFYEWEAVPAMTHPGLPAPLW